jgi:hypothetical protein
MSPALRHLRGSKNGDFGKIFDILSKHLEDFFVEASFESGSEGTYSKRPRRPWRPRTWCGRRRRTLAPNNCCSNRPGVLI